MLHGIDLGLPELAELGDGAAAGGRAQLDVQRATRTNLAVDDVFTDRVPGFCLPNGGGLTCSADSTPERGRLEDSRAP